MNEREEFEKWCREHQREEDKDYDSFQGFYFLHKNEVYPLWLSNRKKDEKIAELTEKYAIACKSIENGLDEATKKILEARTKEVAELDQSNAEKEARIVGMEGSIDELHMKIHNLENANSALDEEAEKLTKEIADLTKQLEKLRHFADISGDKFADD
jgi:chromosome segregation ATPase